MEGTPVIPPPLPSLIAGNRVARQEPTRPPRSQPGSPVSSPLRPQWNEFLFFGVQ